MTESARVGYLYNWDRLRLIAAIDPMAIHVLGTHVFLGIGLPMFLVLSVALSVAKPKPPPTERFILRRWQRIVIPWIFWSLVIGGIRAYYVYKAGEPAMGWFKTSMLFYGPRDHLWFLPFIACFGVLAHFIHKATWRWHPGVLCIASVIVAVFAAWIPTQFNLEWPYRQWVFSLPTLPLGLAVGRMLSFQKNMTNLRLWALLLFAIYAVLGWSMYHFIEPVMKVYLIRFGGGLLVLTIATWLPNFLDKWTAKIVPNMLGLYVLHPLVFALFLTPYLKEHGLIDVPSIRLWSTFFGTFAFVALLRLTPLKRVL
ncbi:MAG: acyltransferase family protein [Myxococcales bacterium]|nr:MAG: acyltransferase family protein [Myxococcales bacterium]